MVVPALFFCACLAGRCRCVGGRGSGSAQYTTNGSRTTLRAVAGLRKRRGFMEVAPPHQL